MDTPTSSASTRTTSWLDSKSQEARRELKNFLWIEHRFVSLPLRSRALVMTDAQSQDAGQSVNDFDIVEMLYRVIPPTGIDGDKVMHHSIDFPNTSVNRSRFSQPTDVLGPEKFADYAVAALAVRDLPPRIAAEDGRVFEASVDHVPTEHSYAHSEIRAFVNSVRHNNRQRKKKSLEDVPNADRGTNERCCRLLTR